MIFRCRKRPEDDDRLRRAIASEKRAVEAERTAQNQLDRARDLAAQADQVSSDSKSIRDENHFIETYLQLFAPRRREQH